MFDKKDDQLFDFAFGELDAQEAQIFEASLLKDASASKEVEFLRTLKEDLASFRDIPEMQFSKERLRSAILEQGLKPKKPGVQWINWLLAPTAVACVAALGIVMLNGTGQRNDPRFVANKPLLGDKAAPFNPAITRSNEPMVAANSTGTKPGLSVPRVTTKRIDESRRSVRDNGFHMSAGMKEDSQAKKSTREVASLASGQPGIALAAMNDLARPSADGLPDHQAKSVGFGPTGGPGGGGVGGSGAAFASLGSADMRSDAYRVAFPDTLAKSEEAKLVVIDTDQDSGVGAPVATEVNSKTSVVIGG